MAKKKTPLQQYEEIQAKKTAHWEKVRREMMKGAGIGSGAPRVYFHNSRAESTADGSARYQDGYARSLYQEVPGQINMQSGSMPSGAEVAKYAQRYGGGGYDQEMAALYQTMNGGATGGDVGGTGNAGGGGRSTRSSAVGGGTMGGGMAGGAGSNLPPDLAAYLADVKAKNDAAFADTQARIQELRDGHADKRQRALDRIDNYGIAQRMMNDEKKAESLKTQRAFLASKGLSNSSDLPAWQARNDRDWGMVNQQLSENVDDRALKYDTSLTNEYLGAVERINNIPPDMGQALDLAMKYGAGGNGQGYAGIDQQLGAGVQGGAGAAAVPVAATTPTTPPRRTYGAMSPTMALAYNRGMMQQFYGKPAAGKNAAAKNPQQQLQHPNAAPTMGPVVDPTASRGFATAVRKSLREKRIAQARRVNLHKLAQKQLREAGLA